MAAAIQECASLFRRAKRPRRCASRVGECSKSSSRTRNLLIVNFCNASHRYLRREKLIHPPPLMEGEACASRILEVGPAGAKFLGPVVIEVPHFAALRGREREIIVLRSDNGETWREHTLDANDDAVQDVLDASFDGEAG